jgi:hypothetical protein
MTLPRRRLVRPATPAPLVNGRRAATVHKLRDRLTQERIALARWMTRLKRSFHAVERAQVRVARLERQLTTHEEPT